MDQDGFTGMANNDKLAEYLVEPHSSSGPTRSNQTAFTIKSLWKKLSQRDKDQIVYAVPHQDRLVIDCIRSQKNNTCIPGVEITRRCTQGSGGKSASGLTAAMW